MRAGELRRPDHIPAVDLRHHAGDVLGDRAGEQHRLLRQVADVAPERGLRVVGEPGGIEPDRAQVGGDHAREQAAERALAGARGTDNGQARAGLHREAEALQQRLAVGAGDGGILDREPAARCGQAQPRRRAGVGREHVPQPTPAFAGVDHRPPGADQLLDRCERPADQDRGREHGTGGELVLEHEPGTEAHDAGLDHEPDGARQAHDDAAALDCALLRCERGAVQPADAAGQGVDHAQGAHRFGLAGERLGERHGVQLRPTGEPQRAAGQQVIEDREQPEGHGAGKGELGELRVQNPDREQGDGQPGRVEQGGGRRTGERGSELPELAQTGAGFAALAGGRLDQGPCQRPLEARGGTREQARAHHLEQAEREQRDARDQAEQDQGLDAAAA